MCAENPLEEGKHETHQQSLWGFVRNSEQNWGMSDFGVCVYPSRGLEVVIVLISWRMKSLQNAGKQSPLVDNSNKSQRDFEKRRFSG